MKLFARRLLYANLLVLGLGLVAETMAAADPASQAAVPSTTQWPQWRGPEGNGVSRAAGLPVRWSEEEGVAWKCSLPAWGNSTPAIWDNALFLTSHVDDQRLVVLRIDKSTGHIEWTRELGTSQAERVPLATKTAAQRKHQKFHATHNLASPSPVTDGQVVVVHFGNGDLAAYDYSGRQLWKRNLQSEHGEYTIWWGHANSPVLYENLVIAVCMQDNLRDLQSEPSPSYLVAYDKLTGRQVWKTMRMTKATAESCDAYTTPIFWGHGPVPQMIVMGGQMLDAYDPGSGRQLWYLDGLEGNRVITGPVTAGDVVYATQGMRKPLLAVKLGGSGKRPAADVLWKDPQNTPDSPTPVVWENRLYLVTDQGIAKCVDAGSGKLLWKERLKGNYRASPLAADGRIYFLNMEGLSSVVAAGPEFKLLAENKLSDQTIASPAVSAGKLFLRGHKTLYCLGK